MDATENLFILFRARKNVIKMLERRGYEVKVNSWDTSLEDFVAMYSSSPSFSALTIHAKRKGALLLVFFPFDLKLNGPSLKVMCEFADKEKRSNHFIIVYRGTITPNGRDFIADYRAERSIIVESFHISELQYNKLEHELVPKYGKILTPAEEKAVMKKFSNAKKSNFSKILVSDPIAKYLGLRVGNMVEVIREDPQGFEWTSYRVAAKGVTR